MRSDQELSSSDTVNVPEGLCRRFSVDEILAATNNFDDSFAIGQGGFAKVYKGAIDSGTPTVAVKKSKSMSPELRKEFRDEILMVTKFRHSHLVSLIGYCETDKEMILVYEYMAGGTLDDNLHKLSKNGNSRIPLCWVERLKICIGAARGLDYLHTGTGINNKVIHRDIKSSNILLDENLTTAKIADFGMSKIGPANQEDTRVMTRIVGTFGYLDPDYYNTGMLTSKSDVYAFGVILFELLSGRPAVDIELDEDQRSLAGWARVCVKKGKVEQIICPNLKSEILPRSLLTYVTVANKCLNDRPKERPTMTEVLAELVLALSFQETRRQNGKKTFHVGGSKMAEKLMLLWSVIPRPILFGNNVEFDVTEAGPNEVEVAPSNKGCQRAEEPLTTKYRPVKIVEFGLPRQQCMVFLDLTREECANLFPSGRIYSHAFVVHGKGFFVLAHCNMDRQSSFRCFGLFLGIQEKGSATTEVDYEFGARSKPTKKYISKRKGNYNSSGGKVVGYCNLFGIPWKSFMAEDSIYFIDGILHLSVELTIRH